MLGKRRIRDIDSSKDGAHRPQGERYRWPSVLLVKIAPLGWIVVKDVVRRFAEEFADRGFHAAIGHSEELAVGIRSEANHRAAHHPRIVPGTVWVGGQIDEHVFH